MRPVNVNDAVNRWVQRLAVGFMLAAAAGLVGMGIVLYAPSHSEAHAAASR